MKKLKLFGILLVLIAVACSKQKVEEPLYENDTIKLKKRDTIILKDTLINIDTCINDTCYSCSVSSELYSYYNKLRSAYNDNCDGCFSEALFELSNTYIPDSEIPDSIKMVYDVYKEFYSPWDITRIADSEFGDGIFEGIRFYLIQDYIYYDFDFRYNGDNTLYRIDNFHPTIANDTIQLIECNSQVEQLFECFMGAGFVAKSYDSIYVPPYSFNEISERYQYLSKFIRIFPSHWDIGFHFRTHPDVGVIKFNETRDSAQVQFRLGYQGGEAILGNDGEKWNIVDHYMTWIEKK